MNIELITEKSAAYWLKSINELKKDFPKKIVIASIMCGYSKADWVELAIDAEKAGADALELNLSCPHGMGERGMGLACGQNDKMVEDISRWVKEVTKIPVFPKLTPNITDIRTIAEAAQRGGADGVTAINTVFSLQNIKNNGVAWPAVGYEEQKTTFGGMSGSAVRPIALKAIASVAKWLPGFPILGTGGVDSAEAAMMQLMAGASAVQICSAIHNQEYTVINDYITGLKTLLYLQARDDLKGWDGQSPPREFMPRDRVGQGLPKFGPYMKEREKQLRQHFQGAGADIWQPAIKNPIPTPLKTVPSVKDQIGKALARIGDYNHLNQKDQVVALVDPELCINCGKCYMTCNDSAYQAIEFNPESHLPTVTDDCTGCTLCLSVCPIPDCISMVPRPDSNPYIPNRVLAPGTKVVYE